MVAKLGFRLKHYIIMALVAALLGTFVGWLKSSESMGYFGYNEVLVEGEVAVNIRDHMLSKTIAQKVAQDPRLGWKTSEITPNQLISKYRSHVDVIRQGPVVTMVAKAETKEEVTRLLDVLQEVVGRAATEITLQNSRMTRAAIERYESYLQSIIRGKKINAAALNTSKLYEFSSKIDGGELLLISAFERASQKSDYGRAQVDSLLKTLEVLKALNTFTVNFESFTKKELGAYQITESKPSRSNYVISIMAMLVVFLGGMKFVEGFFL